MCCSSPTCAGIRSSSPTSVLTDGEPGPSPKGGPSVATVLFRAVDDAEGAKGRRGMGSSGSSICQSQSCTDSTATGSGGTRWRPGCNWS